METRQPRADTPATAARKRSRETSRPHARSRLSREWSSGSRRYFDWVAGLGRQAALALEHAHQVGVVHRDVKPANLLLDPRGQLWVTDFGLAQVAGDAGLTLTGELLGTLRYASPEQALGRRGVVDHRSDVYSLGATLYELLTLRPLFEGRDRNELLRQIADDEPPPPRSVVPSVPAELETIVLKALRKEPAERYATAQELADDLQRFLDNRPILARRPTPTEWVRKWSRRHPSIVAAGVVILVLLAVRVAGQHRPGPRRTGQDAGRAAEGGGGLPARAAAGRGGRGAAPPRPPLGGRADPGQRGGAGRPAGHGGRAQAAAPVGAGLLPGVHRAAPRRPGRPGGAARHDAARREDPRRPGRAAGREQAVPAGPAGRARRPRA